MGLNPSNLIGGSMCAYMMADFLQNVLGVIKPSFHQVTQSGFSNLFQGKLS